MTVKVEVSTMAFRNHIASASKVINGDAVEEANLVLKPIKVDILKINLTQIKVNLKQQQKLWTCLLSRTLPRQAWHC